MHYCLLQLFPLTFVLGVFGLSLELLPKPSKSNVILMISDGFGPASETFSRSVTNFLGNQTKMTSSNDYADVLMELDSILVGSSRTRSSSSLITDSAAGATAFSCAMKTFNRGIGG